MPKTASLLKAVKAFKKTSHFTNVNDEDSLFYREVEEILINMMNTVGEEPIELIIYQLWEDNGVAFRYGNDESGVRRNFKLSYGPNRVTSIMNMAIRNGLKAEYTPSDTVHKYGKLTIQYIGKK